MKGHLIISKNFSIYDINHNLQNVNIRGNNNTIINPYSITNLYVNGNNNNIEIIREGIINNIKVLGRNNKIHICNNSQTIYNDQGVGNSLVRDNYPLQIPIRKDLEDILDKLQQKNYWEISNELKYNNHYCRLCFLDFTNTDIIKIFSCKLHIFHLNCLKDYLKYKKDIPKCPCCNKSINDINNNNNNLENDHSINDINPPLLFPRFLNLRSNNNNHRMIGTPHIMGFGFNAISNLNINNPFLNLLKKGLDKNILDNMEIAKIKDVDKLDNDKKKCIICLENYVNGDDSIALPCIHIFHASCIKTWLKENSLCPICKNEIKYDNEENVDEDGI